MNDAAATGAGRRRRVTISDVADHAGVSVGTVSRVLNQAENCGLDVRRRVRESIEALGYVPNYAARSLKRDLTTQIGLVVPDLANPVYSQMVVGVQHEAAAAGYHLNVTNSGGTWSEERLALQSLEERQVDGVILCSLQMTPSVVRAVEAHADAVCVIGGLPMESPVDNVRLDSETGAALAVQHLLDGGRERVAFLNGTVGTTPHASRDRGYRRALRDADIEYDERLVALADFTMAGGYEGMRDLWERGTDFGGLLCANDAMALGALRYLQERGVAVPERLGVVGMDDIEAARMSTPTLTTVTSLARERGRIACQLLLARLTSEEDRDPEKITVTPKLILRESSAPA